MAPRHIMLNPYKENGFMFIDPESKICLSIAKPFAVAEEDSIYIESALASGTIVDVTPPPEEPTPPETEVKQKTTKSKKVK